uniref:Uncharacterized protein n=1 Tax=Romanomermis culicivorax TaxID=13658 RepID=A0A915JVU3_ROMCU
MAVVSTTTVNRTRMTATTTTTGAVDDSVDNGPTTTMSGDKFVSMETILAALRRLVDRDNVDQVHEENLTAEVQAMCPQWDCPKWSDAVQLVREYLREGSLQGLCSETRTKGCWHLERGSSYRSTPAEQTGLCPEHRSAPTNRSTRRVNGLTKEQVFRLVCRILREDGRKYNDVYCLCNKCLGAKNGKVSRCRLPPNSKKSKHGQKNMQLLKGHRRLTEKIKAEKSANKKSRKSRSKSAKNRSARSQERRESAATTDAQKKEKSKSRKSSKSKGSSKKSGSKKGKKRASKRSKSRSTSKKNKDQKKGKRSGDEIAEVDGASRSKNKRRMSKKAKESGSKKSKGSDKNRSRSKKRQSKKRGSKKANKARA